MLEKFFEFSKNKTSARTEILGGLTTFLAMAYILFVQPAVLSRDFTGNPTGLGFEAVFIATCLASALASILMGIYARYPIALAPGMGENFFFVSCVMSLAGLGFKEPWRVALGIVFISGVLFICASLGGVREILVGGLSASLRSGIASGIGLFIALIGLRNGGIVVVKAGTGIGLNPHLASAEMAIFCFTLAVTVPLLRRRAPGAILWGILGGAVPAIFFGGMEWPQVFFGFPDFSKNVFGAMDLRSALSPECVPLILVFFFMVLFDTTGTLIAVAEHAGFMRGSELPRAREAFLVDALATAGGAALGTSTVTSYVESAAGVEQGARTGFASVVTGFCFLAALFFSPLIALIGTHPALTAPALLVVGALMGQNVSKIDWPDFSESFPAFLIMIGIPMTYSIADGIALGLVSYPVIKLLSGRAREVRPAMYVTSALLVAYFIFIRNRLA